MNFLQTINIWWFLITLALARSCLMYVVSMERADLCFVHIFFVCVCVCVSCITTFLFDYHAHSQNPEKTAYLRYSFTQTGLISSGYDTQRSINIPKNGPWILHIIDYSSEPFPALRHVSSLKRETTPTRINFITKLNFFFSNQKVPDRPLQISETIWFTIFGIK